MIDRLIFIGFDSFVEASIFGIMFGWTKRHDNGVCGTHIDSQVFDPEPSVRGFFGDPQDSYPATTFKKTICGQCGWVCMGWYDRRERQTRDLANGQMLIYLRFEIRRMFCRRCGAVKRERLDFLADILIRPGMTDTRRGQKVGHQPLQLHPRRAILLTMSPPVRSQRAAIWYQNAPRRRKLVGTAW